MFPFFRQLALMLIGSGYRLRIRGRQLIPERGGLVLVANHVSYIDALFIAASVRRPIRFVMNSRIYGLPVMRRFFALMGAIPIAPRREDPETTERAFEAIAEALERGEAVCIFPEGHLTFDGEVDTFRKGIETIIERTPVPVVPMALRGLWGSVFSRKDGRALARLPSPRRTPAEVVIGAPIPAAQVDSRVLHDHVCGLRGAHA
jgi:1-acyl-sn-glycerol-3-phosphate acyltransferase